MGNLCHSLSLGEFQEIREVETMNSCLPQVQRQTLRKQDSARKVVYMKLQTRRCWLQNLVAAVISNQFLLKIHDEGNYLSPCVWFPERPSLERDETRLIHTKY